MNKFTLIIITLLVGLGALIYIASSNKEPIAPVDTSAAAEIAADDHVLGNADANVVLFEYTDFECPACRAYDSVVKELMAQYADTVAFVPRHFPLYFHQNAKPAAWAAEAAGKQGKYFEISKLIFENQDEWAGKVANVSLFYPYAEQLELDMDQFMADALSDEVKAKVDANFDLGTALGVNATPTFYINGTKIERNPGSLEEFASLLDQALEQVGQAQQDSAYSTEAASTSEVISTSTDA